MSPMPDKKFDAFISYNRKDSKIAEALASMLAGQGLRVWIDSDRLQLGRDWRDAIQKDMRRCQACLILWGQHGLGRVQSEERSLAYVNRDNRKDFHVIYALLPGAEPPQSDWASIDTWSDFRGGLDQPDGFSRLVAALKGHAPPRQLSAELPDEPSPYKGLDSFEPEDARFFFGRQREIEEMLEKLRKKPFLAVLGASGSGKTSVVQAGLLAALQEDRLAGSAKWRQVVLRPGTSPVSTLVSGLARLDSNSDSLRERIQASIEHSPNQLPGLIQGLITQKGRLVLVIDRLEELFLLAQGGDENASSEHWQECCRFLTALQILAEHPHQPVWLIVAMRADFYHRLGEFPEKFAQLMADHQLFVSSMRRQQVEEVVARPAAEVGAVFEKGLAWQIVQDAEGHGAAPNGAGSQEESEMQSAASLPLLQYALQRLWKERRGRFLTWDAYREFGGVAGALSQHADSVINRGLGRQERQTARRLLTSLVWLQEEGVTSGKRVRKSLLLPGEADDGRDESVLQKLADERLLRLRAENGEATVELAHDTLAFHWKTFTDWIRQDREFLLWRQRLDSVLEDWHRHRDPDSLLSGKGLSEAEEWMSRHQDRLNQEERGFILAGIDRRETVRRRWMAVKSAIACLIAIALALGFFSWVQWGKTEHQRQMTVAGRLAVQAQLESQVPSKLPLAFLLALESARRFDKLEERSPQAEHTLRDLFDLLPRPTGRIPFEEDVKSLSYDPQGRFLAVTAGNEIILWENQSESVLHRFCLPGDVADQGIIPTVKSIGVAPDGSRLLALSPLGIQVWELAEPYRQVAHLRSAGSASAMAVGPGNIVASLSGDKLSLWRWDRSDDAPWREIKVDRPYALAISAGARQVAVSSQNAVQIRPLDNPGNKPDQSLLQNSRVTALDFARQGELLAIGTEDGVVIVWNATLKQELQRFKHWKGIKGLLNEQSKILQGGMVRELQFSRDGRYLASTGADKATRVWNLQKGSEEFRIGHLEQMAKAISISPDGRRLATASGREVQTWELTYGLGKKIPHPSAVTRLAYSRDGLYLATAVSGDDQIRIWRTDAGPNAKPMSERSHNCPFFGFSPAANSLATAHESDIWIGEPASPPDSWTHLHHPHRVRELAFDDQGSRLAALISDAPLDAFGNSAQGVWEVWIWDVDHPAEPAGKISLSGHASRIAFSNDRLAAAVGEEVIVYKAANREEDCRFEAQQVNVLAWEPGGERLYVGNYQPRLRIVQGDSCQEVSGLEHPPFIQDLQFSSESGQIVTTGPEDTRIWRIADHQEVGRVPIGANAAGLSPDGNYVALGKLEGELQISIWQPTELTKRACSFATLDLTSEEWREYSGEETLPAACKDLESQPRR